MKKEENVNLITLFQNFYRYKWGVLIILVSTVVITFFYTKQIVPIYSSNILISVESDEVSSIKSLFPNSNVVNIDMESKLDYDIRILKSRYIISEVLNKIDLSKRFFVKKEWKKEELYKNKIPFNIEWIKKVENSSFELILEELDKYSFNLKLKGQKQANQYKYNQDITINNCILKISKKRPKLLLENEKYILEIENNRNNLISHILGNLSIKKDGDKILDINYEDIIPTRAKDILTQLILSYKEYNLKVKQLKDVNNIMFFNKMIAELEKTLNGIGEQLRKYKTEHSELLVIGSEDKFFLNVIEKNRKIANLSLKLNALKITKKRIKNDIYSISLLENNNLKIKGVERLINELIKKKEHLRLLYLQRKNIDTLIINDSTYENILKHLNESMIKLRNLDVEYTSQYPEIKKVQLDIHIFKEELKNYIKKHINLYSKEVSRLKKEVNKNIQTLIESIKKENYSIKKSLEKDKEAINTLPKSTMELRELMRTFKLNQKNYERLLQKRSEALISKASTLSNIQIVDTATLPISPIKPKKSFLYLSSLILGFVLSIIYITLRVYRDTRIYQKEDIPSNEFTLIYEEKKGIIENIWTLVSYMESLDTRKKSKTILITADDYEENKSFITKQLSLVLMSISKKILIIDFDVYQAVFSNSLKHNPTIGLSTILTSKHDIDEIYIENFINYNYQNIDILTAGPILPDGSKLLFNPKVKPLLELLSDRYEYILIDAPPIGKYPVVSILLQNIDIFLAGVKIKKTNIDFFEKINKIGEKNIEKIVFVMD